MNTATLFTAYATAQTRSATHGPRAANSGQPGAALPSPSLSAPTHESMLLNALRNSATGCDQIMQRRIGLFSELQDADL